MSGFFPSNHAAQDQPKTSHSRAIPAQMCGHQPYPYRPLLRRAGLPKRVQVAKQTKALQSMQWRGCSWDPCRPGLLDWDLQDQQFTQTVWVYSNVVGIFVFLWVFWGSRWACKTFLEYSTQRVVWPYLCKFYKSWHSWLVKSTLFAGWEPHWKPSGWIPNISNSLARAISDASHLSMPSGQTIKQPLGKILGSTPHGSRPSK